MNIAKTNVLEVQRNNLGFQLFKRPIMAGIMVAMDLMQGSHTEEIQLHGQQHLLHENGKPLPGPYLWLSKHEVSMDVINVVPYWLDIDPHLRFDLRGAMRNFKKSEYVFRALDAAILRHFTYHVSRTSRGEGNSPEEIERLRTENEEHFQQVRENYRNGIHALMFPEGTTQTDGTVFPVKSGCYNIAKIEREDGSIDLITTIPIGLTYDHISGDQDFLFQRIQRKHAFVTIGKPSYYEPLARREGESDESYVKADIGNHTRRVRERLIDLNTFTVAQLAGEYVLRSAEAGRREISKNELEDIVSQRVERLQRLPKTTFDDQLGNEYGRRHRIEQFWEGLERRGYVDYDGNLDLQKTLVVPGFEHYKRDNPLRYCVNRVQQLGNYRDDIRSVFETTGEEMLKRVRR